MAGPADDLLDRYAFDRCKYLRIPVKVIGHSGRS
jgi:hypothetical protein